jgi:hypothetical protein
MRSQVSRTNSDELHFKRWRKTMMIRSARISRSSLIPRSLLVSPPPLLPLLMTPLPDGSLRPPLIPFASLPFRFFFLFAIHAFFFALPTSEEAMQSGKPRCMHHLLSTARVAFFIFL